MTLAIDFEDTEQNLEHTADGAIVFEPLMDNTEEDPPAEDPPMDTGTAGSVGRLWTGLALKSAAPNAGVTIGGGGDTNRELAFADYHEDGTVTYRDTVLPAGTTQAAWGATEGDGWLVAEGNLYQVSGANVTMITGLTIAGAVTNLVYDSDRDRLVFWTDESRIYTLTSAGVLADVTPAQVTTGSSAIYVDAEIVEEQHEPSFGRCATHHLGYVMGVRFGGRSCGLFDADQL